MNRNYREVSNAISIAADTGNVGQLRDLEDVIHTGMMTGKLSITEAAALQADLTIEIDAVQRGDYLDEGFSAIAQGL